MSSNGGSFSSSAATAKRNFIEYTSIALATFIAIVLVGEILKNQDSILGLDKVATNIIKYAIQAIVFIFFAVLFQWLATRSRDISWWRAWIDPRAQFEGTWFELMHQSHEFQDGKLNFTGGKAKKAQPRYAVFEIRYLGAKEDCYWMSGSVYYPNGTYYSMWRTGSLIFNHNDKRLDYLYTADLVSKPGLLKGLASLTFRRVISGIYDEVRGGERLVNDRRTALHSGVGYLLEDGDKANRSSLEFIRITKEEVATLVPNMDSLHGAEIMREFVRSYDELFGDKLENGIIDPLKPAS